MQGCVYVLLFSWTLVREVFPKCEVVIFQPRKGTAQDLGSIANFYVAIILIPGRTFSACHHISTRGGYPLMPLLSLPFRPSCLHTGLFSHPGITCLYKKHQGFSLPASDSDTSLPLPPSPRQPYPRRCALAGAKTSSSVTLSCIRSTVFLQHVSWRLPPPS